MRSVEIKTRRQSSDSLLYSWLGSNLDKKGLNKFLSDINKGSPDVENENENEKKPESEQLQNIKKVMSAMAGPMR